MRIGGRAQREMKRAAWTSLSMRLFAGLFKRKARQPAKSMWFPLCAVPFPLWRLLYEIVNSRQLLFVARPSWRPDRDSLRKHLLSVCERLPELICHESAR